KAKNDRLEAEIRGVNKENAEAAVKAAIQRGAILPKATQVQNDLINRATGDPSFLSVIAGMQGNTAIGTRITSLESRVTVGNEDPGMIFGALARITATAKKSRQWADKVSCSRDFAALFAGEFKAGSSNRDRLLSFSMDRLEDAIMAADVTDSDLGTLSGTLVVQRTLELLKFTFPSLAMFTT